MNWVWENTPHRGPRLLALLAIANAANDEGEGFLKRATIARRMRTEETAAKRAIAELISSGALQVVGKTKNQVNIYRVQMDQAAMMGGENAPYDLGRKCPVQGGDSAPQAGGENAPTHNKDIKHPSNRPLPGVARDGKKLHAQVCEIVGWDESKDPRLCMQVTNNLGVWQCLDGFDQFGLEFLADIMDAYRVRHPGRTPTVSYIDKVLRSKLSECDQAARSWIDDLAMTAERAVRVKAYVQEGFWLDTYGREPTDAECNQVRVALGLTA